MLGVALGHWLDRNGWVTAALCTPARAERWFPTADQSGHAAIAICRRCPVRRQCEAAGAVERFGIWGGVAVEAKATKGGAS